jgi:transcriptional regulator with XRE-family HTH domain
MSSRTVHDQRIGEEISAVSSLGSRLRHERRLRKLRQRDLAARVGCSESLLSKIELNRISPSLQTLHKIAEALGTSVAALFSDTVESKVTIYRRGERPALQLGGADRLGRTVLERMTPYSEQRVLNANLHIVPPGGGSAGTIAHAGEEVGFVIVGYIELEIDSEKFLLDPGTSFFFNSALPHRYRNIGSDEARIVWINSPPY